MDTLSFSSPSSPRHKQLHDDDPIYDHDHKHDHEADNDEDKQQQLRQNGLPYSKSSDSILNYSQNKAHYKEKKKKSKRARLLHPNPTSAKNKLLQGKKQALFDLVTIVSVPLAPRSITTPISLNTDVTSAKKYHKTDTQIQTQIHRDHQRKKQLETQLPKPKLVLKTEHQRHDQISRHLIEQALPIATEQTAFVISTTDETQSANRQDQVTTPPEIIYPHGNHLNASISKSPSNPTSHPASPLLASHSCLTQPSSTQASQTSSCIDIDRTHTTTYQLQQTKRSIYEYELKDECFSHDQNNENTQILSSSGDHYRHHQLTPQLSTATQQGLTAGGPTSKSPCVILDPETADTAFIQAVPKDPTQNLTSQSPSNLSLMPSFPLAILPTFSATMSSVLDVRTAPSTTNDNITILQDTFSTPIKTYAIKTIHTPSISNQSAPVQMLDPTPKEVEPTVLYTFDPSEQESRPGPAYIVHPKKESRASSKRRSNVNRKFNIPSVKYFCFPDHQMISALCSTEDDSDTYTNLLKSNFSQQFYTFVLTDQAGDYFYGYCRRLYFHDQIMCICILSRHSWPTTFQQLLQIFYEELIRTFSEQTPLDPMDSIASTQLSTPQRLKMKEFSSQPLIDKNKSSLNMDPRTPIGSTEKSRNRPSKSSLDMDPRTLISSTEKVNTRTTSSPQPIYKNRSLLDLIGSAENIRNRTFSKNSLETDPRAPVSADTSGKSPAPRPTGCHPYSEIISNLQYSLCSSSSHVWETVFHNIGCMASLILQQGIPDPGQTVTITYDPEDKDARLMETTTTGAQNSSTHSNNHEFSESCIQSHSIKITKSIVDLSSLQNVGMKSFEEFALSKVDVLSAVSNSPRLSMISKRRSLDQDDDMFKMPMDLKTSRSFHDLVSLLNEEFQDDQPQLSLSFSDHFQNVEKATRHDSGPSRDLEYLIRKSFTRPLHFVPSYDCDFEALFSCIQAPTFVRILLSILQENRIIFTSSCVSTLSSSIFAFVSLLYPFAWHHIFIPLLPPNLLDYVCAPMPFIIGLHSSLVKSLSLMPTENVVFVHLDKGTVSYTSDTDPVRMIPRGAKIELQLELFKLEKLKAKKDLSKKVGDVVINFFASLMKDFIVFRNSASLEKSCSSQQMDVFLSELKDPEMQEFWKHFRQTQMFEEWNQNSKQAKNCSFASLKRLDPLAFVLDSNKNMGTFKVSWKNRAVNVYHERKCRQKMALQESKLGLSNLLIDTSTVSDMCTAFLGDSKCIGEYAQAATTRTWRLFGGDEELVKKEPVKRNSTGKSRFFITPFSEIRLVNGMLTSRKQKTATVEHEGLPNEDNEESSPPPKSRKPVRLPSRKPKLGPAENERLSIEDTEEPGSNGLKKSITVGMLPSRNQRTISVENEGHGATVGMLPSRKQKTIAVGSKGISNGDVTPPVPQKEKNLIEPSSTLGILGVGKRIHGYLKVPLATKYSQ